jgi:hypothetical protein
MLQGGNTRNLQLLDAGIKVDEIQPRMDDARSGVSGSDRNRDCSAICGITAAPSPVATMEVTMIVSYVRAVQWTLAILMLGLCAGSRIVQAFPPIEVVHPTPPELSREPNGEHRTEENPATDRAFPSGHLTGDAHTLRDPLAQKKLAQLDESAGHVAEGMSHQAPLALQVHDLFKEAGPVTTVENQKKIWSDNQRQSAQQLAQRIVLKAMEEVVAERAEGTGGANAAEFKQRLIDTLKHADRRASRTIGGGVWAKVLDTEFPSTTYKTRVLEPGSRPGALDYRVEAVGLPRTTTEMNIDAFAAKAAVRAAAGRTSTIVAPTERDATRTQ